MRVLILFCILEYCTKDLKTVCVYGLQIQVVSDMFSLFSALL